MALRANQLFVKKYYLIDHRILFLFGFVFYLVLPPLLGSLEAFNSYPGVNLFQGFFHQIPDSRIRAYFIITLSWIPAFFIGHLSFRLLCPDKRNLSLFPSTMESKNIYWIAGFLFIFLILFIYVSRTSLFGGALYDVGPRGKLSTLIIVLDFFLIYQLISKTKPSKILVAGTVINAFVLLFAGGRLTALQTFLVFLIYKTSFAPKRWKKRHLLLFAFICFYIGGVIGLRRVNSDLSLMHAGFSLFAEPLFTWFSSASFLAQNDIPLINFPQNFLTSFFNLVPNTIFSLRDFVVPVQNMGFDYSNPFGADSIFTSLVINFGSLGSWIFIFITGFLLSWLRHLSERNQFWACYYILVCAMLPFEFFRTGFFILNKELFVNFLIFPAVLLFMIRMLSYIQRPPIKHLYYHE